MQKFSIQLIIVSLSVFLLLSCHSVKPLEYRKCVHWKLNKLGFSQSTLDLDLVYFNPNRIGLMLDQVELDVFLNGKSLGNTHQRTQIHIPGKQEFTLPVSINLDMKNLLGNAISSMMNEKVKLRTVGKVRVGKAGIYQWIPLDITNEMSMSPFR